MRYYAIRLAGADGNVFPAVPGAIIPGAQWCTVVNGRNDPSALQIDFQIEEETAAQPSENSILNIHGIPFSQLVAAGSLIGKAIAVYGGMFPNSFPLAYEQGQHSGLLLLGIILKAWGNWIGTEMSIGFSFMPVALTTAIAGGGPQAGGQGGSITGGQGAPSAQMMNGVGPRSLRGLPFARGFANANVPASDANQPVDTIPSMVGSAFTTGANLGASNFRVGGYMASFFGGGNMNPLAAPINMIHNMMPNMPASSAIRETLSKAFPNANLDIRISEAIKLGYQDAGMYQTLEQYAKYIQQLSHSVLGSNQYLGVNMSAYDSTLHVWDGTNPWGAAEIKWYDLIGQPTWIDVQMIHIKCVLRADIHIGMTVTLPKEVMWINVQSSGVLAGTPESSMPEQKRNVAFTGKFKVMRVYHVGDFRNPDGANWSTNIHAQIDWASTPVWDILTQAPNLGINPADVSLPAQTPTQQATPQAARTMLRSGPRRRVRMAYG